MKTEFLAVGVIVILDFCFIEIIVIFYHYYAFVDMKCVFNINFVLLVFLFQNLSALDYDTSAKPQQLVSCFSLSWGMSRP